MLPLRILLPLLLLPLLWPTPARCDVLFPALPATAAPEQAGARLLLPRSTLPTGTVITTLERLDGVLSDTVPEPIDPAVLVDAQSDATAALLFLPAGLRSVPVSHTH